MAGFTVSKGDLVVTEKMIITAMTGLLAGMGTHVGNSDLDR